MEELMQEMSKKATDVSTVIQNTLPSAAPLRGKTWGWQLQFPQLEVQTRMFNNVLAEKKVFRKFRMRNSAKS